MGAARSLTPSHSYISSLPHSSGIACNIHTHNLPVFLRLVFRLPSTIYKCLGTLATLCTSAIHSESCMEELLHSDRQKHVTVGSPRTGLSFPLANRLQRYTSEINIYAVQTLTTICCAPSPSWSLSAVVFARRSVAKRQRISPQWCKLHTYLYIFGCVHHRTVGYQPCGVLDWKLIIIICTCLYFPAMTLPVSNPGFSLAIAYTCGDGCETVSSRHAISIRL